MSARKLLTQSSWFGLLTTDSVFSMDSNLVPLPELSQFANDYNWLFRVDDARGLGYIGRESRVSLDLAGLIQSGCHFWLARLAKRLVRLVHMLPQVMLFRIMSHSLLVLMCTPRPCLRPLCALLYARCVRCSPILAQHIRYLHDRMMQIPVKLMASNTTIQSIAIGDSHAAIKASDALQSLGIVHGNPTGSFYSSLMPLMPRQHSLMPASRTRNKVSKRSW